MDHPSNPFAIVSRRIALPDRVGEAAILVRDGRIESVVLPDAVPEDYERRDYGDHVVMAGLVDPHVHVNEPGRSDWEGFRTATRAAAAGGTTTIVDMPLNSLPVTISVDALDRKLEATSGKLFVDCGFYGGAVPRSAGEVKTLVERGVFGIKVFLIESGLDEFPPVDEATLDAIMTILGGTGVPLLAHAELRGGEDDSHSPTLPTTGPVTAYPEYLSSRPPAWETRAISLLARLSERHGCPTHIVHLAAAEGIEIIARARRHGAPISVETCPHYLYFDAESIPPGKTLLKCAPPIRGRMNNDRLLSALLSGEIDFVATDHSPTIPAAKAVESGDFTVAWGGIASIQLRLPVMWTIARRNGARLSDLANWLASNPARFLGLDQRKGSILPGRDADLVIWDPDVEFTVTPEILHDRHQLTPYLGHRLFGTVKATYLRGRVVFEDGHFAEPSGQALFRT